jgi:hypothetical protein
MDLQTFIAKWRRVDLSERAASQAHFMDLCALLKVKNPIEADPTGEVFTFEKPVRVTAAASAGSAGDRGFADVWYKGRFGWEYKRKGKYKTLADAYRQLCQYRDDLGNPPLLIVSDIAHTEIHTNFTGFKPDLYTVDLEELDQPGKLDLLRRAFTAPESFKPNETPEEITQKAAKEIGKIAQGLRDRGHDPHAAAHFLMKVMFCLFAEDVDLLPKGLFEKMLTRYRHEPPRLKAQMDALFGAMRTGGDFGIDEIAYFNGGLFDTAGAIELTEPEIAALVAASAKDWGNVEPSIFGTLFERSLDPDKRAQIGAHYTSREDIMLVIEPVILRPLRREWGEVRAKIDAQLERRRAATTPATKKKADAEIADLLDGFQQRLASVRVLDPACGSGNFLYVAIQSLLDLELEVIVFAGRNDIGAGLLPRVRPTQLHGIEINPYAAELAQVVIWIGYLQWMRDNGFNAPRDPILEPIETIENRDAILAWEDRHGEPVPAWREGAICRGQAEWPEADYIVGNPPFLGAKRLRTDLGDVYVAAMHGAYALPNFSDLCCYWFASAVRQFSDHPASRFGLLATQAIRGGSNRTVLDQLVASMDIFNAWSDRDWVLEGANVRISIICAAPCPAEQRYLDGFPTDLIHSDLSGGVAISAARQLRENHDLCYMGIQFNGPFDMDVGEARRILSVAGNTNGRSSLDVLSRLYKGTDITRRCAGNWAVNYRANTELPEAAQYIEVFDFIERIVRPAREASKAGKRDKRYWLPLWPRPEFTEKVEECGGFIATTAHAKHRLFVLLGTDATITHAAAAFVRTDFYFFGVLHSSTHELWSLGQCTHLEDRPRYTSTTCFETFSLPWPPGSEPGEGDPHRPLHDAIADAARTLNEQRERWLNPPEWIAEIAEKIDAADDFADVARVSGEEARRLIRQSAIDAAAAKDPRLKKRTLTNLYNQRPTWLRLAHKALDEAVLAAYAAVDPEGDWSPAWAAVFEETGAGQPLPPSPPPGGEGEPVPHPLADRRAEVEQSILANLLRLNLARAGQGA